MSVLGRSLPQARGARLDRALLAPVFTTVFVGMLWWIGFRPFVSQAAGDIGSSVPAVGQALTAAALLTAVAGLFTGPVADHYGHRRSILVGLGFLAASATVMGTAPNIFILTFGSLLGGFGMALTYGVAFAVVSTHFSGNARRRTIGMTQASASLAVVAGTPALVFIATFVLWRGALVVLAGTLLVALLIAYRMLPADPPVDGRCASPRIILGNYRPLVAAASMRSLYIVSALRSIAVGGLPVYLGAYYVDVVSFSTREVGVAFMLEGVGQVLGNLAAGGRLGGLNQRTVFATGTLLIGVGALAIYTVQPAAFVIVGLAMLIAFVAGITFTSLTTMLAAETPVGAATTMVLNISTIAIGVALGSALGGALIRLGGYELIGIAALVVAASSAALVVRGRSASARGEVPGSAGETGRADG